MTDFSRFGEIFTSLRKKEGISQEALADKLGVSKQAIQKWETGKSFPDFSNLAAIAEYWNVSYDYLLAGTDKRDIEQLRTDTRPLPSYGKQPSCEAFYKELPTEYRQCFDEGKDVEAYKDIMFDIDKLPDGQLKSKLADDIYTALEAAKIKDGYGFSEPSELERIISQSSPVKYDYKKLPDAVLTEKINGAWYGRICGCLLGKPIEGIKRKELYPFLKATDNYPIKRYLVKSDWQLAGDMQLSYPLKSNIYADGALDGMPIDDDTNYIILALLLIKKYGRNFTPDDVAKLWLDMQPKNAYYTAERVAFRNFVDGFCPPESARYKNPYREWIGAQIRGDFFGWINPGDPKTAAEYAWRDASISHVKNGIYGEMWVSAMLAAVLGGADIKTAIKIGASYIPTKSRLNNAIENVFKAYESGMPSEAFFEDFHKRWNEYDGYDWCHTVSNAEIVTAALLWGDGDYAKSVCLAVNECFDTDCNGATVGSVVGAAKGFCAVPREFSDKISDTLFTSIFGYEKVSVSEMARETINIIKQKI